MGGILLWIVLISTALGTVITALSSSGAGRLWVVDSLELRRRRRFKQVLSLHVDATRLSRREAAAPVWPVEEPVGVRAPGSFMSHVGHPSYGEAHVCRRTAPQAGPLKP
ncbi:hypothetical protein [Streptomyces sp. NRRL F-4474]|uniref:hypothetical protein n=1 Tax=Streptomyces sp. NRRL F-4474 TaxID=1463851 RepID=UPI0004C8AD10|nr:hypothetical protein [Streptomyces sp. NRRL F-4474]